MILQNIFLENLILLFFYMFIYNISLIFLFWLIQQIIYSHLKTLFSLNDFKLNNFYLVIITVLIFSIAGVPPFLGFFTKLLILVMLLHTNFIHLYIVFFIILLFSLYFYIQNIRFLYSISLNSTISQTFKFQRILINFPPLAIFVSFFLFCGCFFLNDFILYFNWLLL